MDEETRRKVADAARRHWQIPSIRERMIRGLRRSQRRKDVREKIAAGMRRYRAEQRAKAEAGTT